MYACQDVGEEGRGPREVGRGCRQKNLVKARARRTELTVELPL